METSIAWKESTQKIFWGVIIIAVAGIFNVLYDYVSYVVGILEFVAEYLPNGNNGLGAFFASIHTLGFTAKLAVVVGYVLYLLGLTRFAAMQTNTAAAQNIQKVRTAVIILICCFAAGAVFGILFSIPFLGTLISLVVWIATLVAYFKMKNAFNVLMTSLAFSPASQKGAKKLHYAAVCNIRLMLMPIAVALISGLLVLLAVAMLKGNSNPAGLLYIGGIVGVAVIICALVFMFFALVYPFIGWYQIMNGGAGEDALTDEKEIEQRMAAIPTTDEQVKELKEKGGQVLASAKDSVAKMQKDFAPKWQRAKAGMIANKKKIGLGVGAAAVIALLVWILPKLFAGSPKPVVFETYEVMDDIGFQVSVDIPVADGEKEQNVSKGICELIGSTHIAEELGAPMEGVSPREVIDDYNKRFKTYLDNFQKETGAPVTPICQLFIESEFQNEACVVFQVAGSIYMNGAPDTYLRAVRLADGHVMKQEEMVNITAEQLEPIIKKYQQEEMGIWLEDGFYISPAAKDCCKITWPIGHGYNEVLVPLSAIESYVTEDGKTLLTAKPLDVPEEEKQVESAQEEQTGPDEEESNMEVNNNRGLVGLLSEGTTEYEGEMAGFPIKFSITKESGSLRAVYKNVKFGATMKLESDAQVDEEGNTTFWGNDTQGNQWQFHLGGQ